MGCWVLVVAARMVGCRLLGFGCGSYDDGLWWQGFGCGSYDDGLWWQGFGCGSYDDGLWWLGWWVVGCWVLVVAVGMVSCGCL